ncbi:hypothetical protein CLAFUW4_05489 [Fulvia fulva]|uniref:uncharacterized protein n=1 Tax=Passalora fulva TaxID=5499 RepID=UPI0028526B95|nr:uncharacterized protein CLAFUR5_20204 [Fulvia fulva]KAK4624352.1 hypothetical protein CLAFUR4_05483 [Fulvia fulva]KAK4624837.1 hypothetical protein CLAFUR0_05491 [Fulvia fulva]WMI38896.1 hypothetical protein CLAFUR5_20204 [Fulvia fulva]WPV14504.1 hypothetical protein CLAFUW4_05489 [Fulvia fulva]WPV29982.1 hypothetical protein CLAFUW7_05487 [Fulvia fulva]
MGFNANSTLDAERKIYTGCAIQRKIYTGCVVQRKIYTGCELQRKIYTGCTLQKTRNVDFGKKVCTIQRSA